MAKYIKFIVAEKAYAVIKINDDGSALQVSIFAGKPAIEYHHKTLSVWNDYVETTQDEFIEFYLEVNKKIIIEILK